VVSVLEEYVSMLVVHRGVKKFCVGTSLGPVLAVGRVAALFAVSAVSCEFCRLRLRINLKPSSSCGDGPVLFVDSHSCERTLAWQRHMWKVPTSPSLTYFLEMIKVFCA
jgi:hypothetical protein